MSNSKEKLLSSKFIQDFLDNKQNKTLIHNDKFIEIACSLAYYLKSFSNIKRFLDYISLISKYIFENQFILIIPLAGKYKVFR